MKNIKILLVLFLSLLTFAFASNQANASVEKKTIRVGISNSSFSSWDYKKVKFSSQNIIKIVDMAQNSQIEDIEAGKIIEITFEDGLFNIYINNELKYKSLKGPLLLSSNADLEILELNRKGMPAKYKGMIELRNSKNSGFFNVINVVDMENYVKGVVPNEMPVSFGKEALKAQAVAARNYATNAQISPFYDVVDSTASQVYYGSNSYTSVSNQAVDETKGIYALYKGKPISALYYSTSAGISDDWDDVFNNGQKSNLHPYLKAKYETTKTNLRTENDVIKFYSAKNGFDTNSPKLRWSVEFDREELENILHTTLLQQSGAGLVEPKYTGSNKIEGLKELKPLKRTQSGKITELLITAQNGEYKVKKELGIRRVLKKNNSMLPSANFFVQTFGEEFVSITNPTFAANPTIVTNVTKNIPLPTKEKAQKIKVSNQPPKKENLGLVKLFSKIEEDFVYKQDEKEIKVSNKSNKYPKTFKLTGGGFGHGVGMSQFGAYSFAKAGKKYPEILHFYYTDINLSTIPVEVLYNEYNISYKTEFYFDKHTFQKAYIIIDNKKRISEFKFKINQQEFSADKSMTGNELTKMDITNYLNQGMNVIEFPPLSVQNRGRNLVYCVEFI